MKVKEIILELREILKSQHYGAWLNSNTKEAYYVDEYQHRPMLRDIIRQEYDIDTEEEWGEDGNPANQFAFSVGYIRLVFGAGGGSGMENEGTRESFTKASAVLLASVLQQGIDRITMDLRTPEDGTYLGHKTFMLPNERRELMMFIKGES